MFAAYCAKDDHLLKKRCCHNREETTIFNAKPQFWRTSCTVISWSSQARTLRMGHCTFSHFLSPNVICPKCYRPKAQQSTSWERNLTTAFGCLASALAFIHSKDVAIKHKGIKPANILFCGDIVLLSDWGLSNSFKSEATSRSRGWTYCTPAYAAPEVRATDERGTAQDIFSPGLVYVEMWAALCRVLIWDQTFIGESRTTAHHGIDMMPEHYAFLAQGPVPANVPQLRDITTLLQSSPHYEAQDGKDVPGRTFYWEARSPTLFEIMLAKLPADRPTAHQVWHFMKAPNCFSSPCDGCLHDETRREAIEA